MYAAKKAPQGNRRSAGIRFGTLKQVRDDRADTKENSGTMTAEQERHLAMEQLRRYVDQTNEIRDLSSPKIGDMTDADSYHAALLRNFSRIGELARDNVRILETYFFPVLQEGAAGPEDLEEMRAFSDMLVDAYNMKNLDTALVYYNAERLLRESEKYDNDEIRILALDGMITAAYLMVSITSRLLPVSDCCYEYFNAGHEAGEKLLEYLAHDKFLSLSQEMKELIVVDARYIRVVAEIDDVPVDAATREMNLQRMKDALALAEDPFYRDQLPGYDWDYHLFRTYEYIACFTDLNNSKGYDRESIRFINECTKRMRVLYESDRRIKSIHLIRTLPLFIARNSYLAGETDLESYKSTMEAMIYHDYRRDPDEHLPLIMLQTPIEYTMVLDPEHMSAEEAECLNYFYQRLIGYIHKTPKKNMLSFLLTALNLILKYFIETPGGTGMENFGLGLIAALFPTTFVHTLSVADIAKTLTHHLLQKSPELFLDMPGYDTADDVREHAEEIENYAYHASLCHDFGKLLIAETLLLGS